MREMACQITSLAIVCAAVYLGADQRKYQSCVSLAFVRGIHRWPVNSPHKWPVARKTFPFDDVIMFQVVSSPFTRKPKYVKPKYCRCVRLVTGWLGIPFTCTGKQNFAVSLKQVSLAAQNCELDVWASIILCFTHILPVPHTCASQSDQYWFRQWLVAYSAPNDYLNQCRVDVNWTFRNKITWNLNRNAKLFVHKNAFENIFSEMAAILSRKK